MLKVLCSAIVAGMFSLILYNAYNLQVYHTDVDNSVKTIYLSPSSSIDVEFKTGSLFEEDDS